MFKFIVKASYTATTKSFNLDFHCSRSLTEARENSRQFEVLEAEKAKMSVSAWSHSLIVKVKSTHKHTLTHALKQKELHMPALEITKC